MAIRTHRVLVLCVVVLASLFQYCLSEHVKKKIIVKVPHLIKHIHHNHFKPVHVHKVHAKKVEHHHHDKHEEELGGWSHGHKKSGSKHKVRGSYSHLEPVLAHQDGGEHMGYEGGFSQDQGFNRELDHEHSAMYGSSEEERGWNSGNNDGNWKNYNGEHFNEGRSKWAPFDLESWENGGPGRGEYSGEDWLPSSEEMSDFRGEHGLAKGNAGFGNDHKKKKSKHLNWRSEEPDNGGWRPMMDFSGWKDVRDIKPNAGRFYEDPYIHSGEELSGGVSDERGSHSGVGSPETNAKRKKKKKNRKKNGNKPRWSKQIEVREPSSEEEQQQQQIYQQPHPHQVERPEVAQNPSQLLHVQHLQLQHTQPQPTSWSLPAQQDQTVQSRWPALPKPQPQQQQEWPPQQSSSSVWHQQPVPQQTTQSTSTQPRSVVWSGHHLQLPQHSMWHVQQHSVQALPAPAVPLQILPVTPRPLLPVSAPQFLPLRQTQLSSQIQQASAPLHQVLPPNWPLNQKSSQSQHPQVKQQWEQSVQTSGRDGPASSYKVEVINYMDQKSQ